MIPAFLLFQSGGQGYEIGSANSEAVAYVKLLVVLGVILGAAVVGVHVILPRLAGLRRPASGVIQVSTRMLLEPKKHLYVVQVGSEYFLIGTSESGMQCLTPLKRDSIEPALSREAPPDREFPTLMQAFRRWKKAS